MLRRHGGRVKYHHDELGLNSRLDELQAAILRVKLPHLNAWNRARQRHAYTYNRLLSHIPGVVRPLELGDSRPPEQDPGQMSARIMEAVYHQYTVLTDDRDAELGQLTAAGIGCSVYYPLPLHLQPVHRKLGYQHGSFPVAESIAQRCLSLPMFPELTAEQQQRVIGTTVSIRDQASVRRRMGTVQR
jgi:dTDP-4-amino-4,6-dideoxygalactose transaminase